MRRFCVGVVLLTFFNLTNLALAATPEDCDKLLRWDRYARLRKVHQVFRTTKPVIAMLHLAGRSDQAVVAGALEEMKIFEQYSVDAVIVENYHGSTQNVIQVLRAIQGRFPSIAIGINILPNEFELAFELADTFDAKFIQLDFIAGKYDPEIQLDEATYLEYRKKYPDIFVMGGVWPKYYTPAAGSDLKADLHRARELVDAVVVTGEGTGSATPTKKIKMFRKRLGLSFPLIVGAGVSIDSVREQLSLTEGLIIGSYFKGGETASAVIPSRVQKFMSAVREVRHDSKFP